MPQTKRKGKVQKFLPTDKQSTEFDHTVAAESRVDLYGKVLTGNSAATALVFGVRDGLRCMRLPSPRYLTLPAPDGPADGCGWDPDEYVVWKGLPKNHA